MKVFITGTRGIPDIPGGVETHCQNLYPLLINYGIELKVSRRNSYTNDNLKKFKGIELVDLSTPRKKSLEAIIHTFFSIVEAKRWGADILHVHAIGPALMIPFARLLGLKVIFTHHGPDYDRDKWGPLAKWVLKLGEKLGGLFSNEVIVISNVIGNIVKKRCNRGVNLIYNGVITHEKSEDISYLSELGVEPFEYIIAVARFVPEKGLHDLIEAYKKGSFKKKLIIAGDSDHEDDYSRSLKESVKGDKNIILTGFITGIKLHQILSNASLFVLPSYHEGLPISLLEALSYGVTPLVSNIPANLEVGLEKSNYFIVNDIDSLTLNMSELLEYHNDNGAELIDFVKNKYDWNIIAKQTLEVYQRVLKT